MILESPVKKFSGTVVLPDYLNISQVRAFEAAQPTAEEIQDAIDNPQKVVYISVGISKKLPAILACVKEWNIKGVPSNPTIETFPSSPVKAAGELVDWIYKEIQKIWIGETEIPNA